MMIESDEWEDASGGGIANTMAAQREILLVSIAGVPLEATAPASICLFVCRYVGLKMNCTSVSQIDSEARRPSVRRSELTSGFGCQWPARL